MTRRIRRDRASRTTNRAGAGRRRFRSGRLNHRCRVLGGIRAGECAGILRRFFLARRAEGKK